MPNSPFKTKKVLDKAFRFIKDEYNYPRCHLDLWENPHTLCRIPTYPSQL